MLCVHWFCIKGHNIHYVPHTQVQRNNNLSVHTMLNADPITITFNSTLSVGYYIIILCAQHSNSDFSYSKQSL